MLVTELFKKKIPYEVVKHSKTHFKAEGMINDRKIVFYAAFADEEYWTIGFAEEKNGQYTSAMTGSGASLDVLTMVKDAMHEFIEAYHPDMMAFSASKDDRSRASVYERMIKRLLPPGYKVAVDKDPKDNVDFMITRA
jgi:hypothetical protein